MSRERERAEEPSEASVAPAAMSKVPEPRAEELPSASVPALSVTLPV